MNPVADAFQQVLAALDTLEIRYAVGGSVASSIRGNYRYTNDIDILVEMVADQVGDFVARLGPDFYADVDRMREAFRLGRAWNLIHTKSACKFDLFPANTEFTKSELARRRFEVTGSFGPEIEFAVTSAEDILLYKLVWYRRAGETSEQQWRDASGIVAVQGDRLDRAYLREWAPKLRVEDLLERLLSQPPAQMS
ncbi:MAG: hypothetical protein U0Q16_29045 [Bryobacteraceae bacterium]